MSSNFTVAAELRTDTGKGASRRLRHENKVPAIMYGADLDPMILSLASNEINHSVEDEAFFSHILTLSCDGTDTKVIIKDLQRHPARNDVTHVDFQRVDENKVLHVHVPLHYTSEDLAPGVKAGGIVAHLKTDVEITCLPKDLPEYLEVDLAGLEVGESLHLSDIKLVEGLTILELAQGEAHDLPIVNIVMPRGEQTDEEVAADAEEGEGEEAE